jgi:hypothetical protein
MDRGTIYVYRVVDGEEEAIELYHQSDYREWVGCWSAI